jgi:hypothetical protein
MTNPNKDGLLQPQLPENACGLATSGVLLHPAYSTDEYPRRGLCLVIDLQADGKSWLCVYHPDKKTPLESYPCADEAMLHQRIAEWLSRHPAEVTGDGADFDAAVLNAIRLNSATVKNCLELI